MKYHELIEDIMTKYGFEPPMNGEIPEVWLKKLYEFICFLEKRKEDIC